MVDDWDRLYETLLSYLCTLGKSSATGQGDFWLRDDDWGNNIHMLYINSTCMLKKIDFDYIQEELRKYSGFRLVVSVVADLTDQEGVGLVVWPERIDVQIATVFLSNNFPKPE